MTKKNLSREVAKVCAAIAVFVGLVVFFVIPAPLDPIKWEVRLFDSLMASLGAFIVLYLSFEVSALVVEHIREILQNKNGRRFPFLYAAFFLIAITGLLDLLFFKGLLLVFPVLHWVTG